MNAQPNTQLTPEQVAKWLREQAKMFNQMALNIESMFSLAKSNGTLPLPSLGTVTARQIHEALDKKAMRVADLVQEFQADEFDIRKIVNDPANGLTIGDRGWIKKVEQKT